jgi:hypothetical protein
MSVTPGNFSGNPPADVPPEESRGEIALYLKWDSPTL